MNRSKNRKNSFSHGAFITIFVFCLLFSFSAVFAFQYFYFPVRYAELRTSEMENVFGEEELFAKRARSILATRSDVGYVRLLDRDGVLEKSFGVQHDQGYEKLVMAGPGGKTVLVGVRPFPNTGIYFDILLWSLLIGSLMAVVFSFFLRLMNNLSFRHLKEFSGGMKLLSEGDYSARLDARSSMMINSTVVQLCREFNEMASSLEKAVPPISAVPADESPTVKAVAAAPPGTGPLFSPPPASAPVEPADSVSAPSPPEDSETEKELSVPIAAPPKKTWFSALVVKIEDFDSLVRNLDSSEMNSLTAKYRKSLSNFITSFGGVVEKMLEDEVVALFPASGDDERMSVELRSVCSAVETMQFFGGARDRHGTSSRVNVKVKAGISSSEIEVPADSGISAAEESVVDEARTLCDGAKSWNIFVSVYFRENLRDYLEVRREYVNGKLCYSVKGVEEKALESGGV